MEPIGLSESRMEVLQFNFIVTRLFYLELAFFIRGREQMIDDRRELYGRHEVRSRL